MTKKKKNKETKKVKRTDPPNNNAKKTPPFCPLNSQAQLAPKKKIACSRLERVERRRTRRRRTPRGEWSSFFFGSHLEGALFALHRPKPRGVSERRDRRERKNWWSSRVDPEEDRAQDSA